MTAIPQVQPESAYIGLRRQLINNGYVPIPVDGKRPRITGWSALRPTVEDIAGLSREHPDHKNTGLLTGDVIAIDIDVLDLDTAMALEDVVTSLPGGDRALRRVGRAPKSLFIFRAAEAREKIKTAEYLIEGEKCQVEILGVGQQFVAFGIHPDTGAEYEWTTASPLDIAFADLPEMSADTLLTFMERAEAILAGAGEPVKKKPAARASSGSGTTFWQKVNSAALDSTDAWIRDLFPTATKEAGTGAWRVSSKSLGRSLEEDISIHADGIQDFGLEQPETPISLVEKYGGAPSAKDAALWLCERLGRDPADFGWQVRKPVEMRFDSDKASPQAANDDYEDVEDYAEHDVLPDFLKRDKVLSDFTHPGGFMEEVIDWITSSAETPSRELALSATLPFVASLIGRRFGTTSRDTRANMYVVALAPSGFGKDHARGQLKRLRVAADGWLDKFFGPERLMSASALRNELQDSPSRICLIDEFGGFVRDITDRKAAPHVKAISTDLRDIFSAANTLFGGAAYANTKAVEIHNPNLNIYGTATPGQFWSAMRNASAEDGLLPRFLLFSLERASEVELVVPDMPVSSVPARIIDRAIQLAGINKHLDEKPKLGKVLERVAQEGGKVPTPVVAVAWTDDALGALAAFKRAEVKATREADEIVSPFIARTTEYAIKLALILAVTSTSKTEKHVSRGKVKTIWSRPLVDMAVWEWASGLAVRCIADMATAIDKFVADNEKEALSKQVRDAVQKAKDKGITEGGIIRALPEGHNTRIRIEVLADLVLAGRIRRVEKEPTGKGGRPSVRFHRQIGTDSQRGTA